MTASPNRITQKLVSKSEISWKSEIQQLSQIFNMHLTSGGNKSMSTIILIPYYYLSFYVGHFGWHNLFNYYNLTPYSVFLQSRNEPIHLLYYSS